MRKQFFDMSFGTLRLVRSIVAATVFALCSLLLAPCSSVRAQEASKVFRIGFLDRSTRGSAVYVDAFRQELSKLGWTELRTTALKAVGSFPSKDG